MSTSEKAHPYPNFAKAVREMGGTVEEIANLLGVSPRSVASYLNGSSLPHTRVVKEHPTIDLALSLDFASKRHLALRKPADLGHQVPAP